MTFAEGVANLAKKIRDTRSVIETEEATKTAFIMPFISNVLGYDVFDPAEVVPEFTADVGVKRGEKVDYAIVKDGKVQRRSVTLSTSGMRRSCSGTSLLLRPVSPS